MKKLKLNLINKNKPSFLNNFSEILFSWEELEHLLNLRPFVNSKRFAFSMQPGSPRVHYNWKHEAWLTDVNSWPPTMIDEVINKYVVHLPDSSRANQKINNVCQQLEKKFNCPADAHIYFSVKGKDELPGFEEHFDRPSNLIIQVHGETRFKIWNKTTDESLLYSRDDFKIWKKHRDENLKDVKPVIDKVMKPGDAVWVPPFYWHRADSLTKRLSISFPIATDFHSPLSPSQDRHWIEIK